MQPACGFFSKRMLLSFEVNGMKLEEMFTAVDTAKNTSGAADRPTERSRQAK